MKQNVAVEIYEDYFSSEDAATRAEEFSVDTIISYPDPAHARGSDRRPVSVEHVQCASTQISAVRDKIDIYFAHSQLRFCQQ